jgi:hypothetical protein
MLCYLGRLYIMRRFVLGRRPGFRMGDRGVRAMRHRVVRLMRFGRMRAVARHYIMSFSHQTEQHQRGTGDRGANQAACLLEEQFG